MLDLLRLEKKFKKLEFDLIKIEKLEFVSSLISKV